jgi:catechol 2,3-dioxygenase-like lactoylglutathione lyase family enzyme
VANHIHHVHIFASDLDKSIRFYQEYFGAKLILDAELAGARNVFMRIGNGRLHFYDQPPKNSGRGSIHHFGIQTDDIEGLVEKMRAEGVEFKKGVTDFGFWKSLRWIKPLFLPSSQIISSRIVSLNRWGRGLRGRRVDG